MPPRVTFFFDLDGVLADFVRGACEFHGSTLHHDMSQVRWDFHDKLGVTPEQFWQPLGYNFWVNLAPLPDGFALLRQAESLVGAGRIGLLTSAAGVQGCVDGKRAWVKKYLPDYLPRMFTGSAKELFASESKVLVDDHDPNCDKFRAHGGRAVLVPRPWNARRAECSTCGSFDFRSVGWELMP